MEDKQGGQTVFNKAYQSLNASQKKAVDTIEGPVMVIAGPGTGKTQILTLRIAKILLATDVQPENILALTFTESGARAMRSRLRSFVGSAAYRVAIHTFHGFAGELISRYPDAYTRIIGGRPIDDLEVVEVIESLLDSSDIKHLRPAGNVSFYVQPIKSAIANMKRENIQPDDLAKIVVETENNLNSIEKINQKGAHKGKVRGEYKNKEKELLRQRELLTVYRQYESVLADRRLFDFEDMIVETVAALERDESMLRDLQESYQYILADEHQDVNGSQNRILELLCDYHDQPNIFVVGDEKQAIYRFQGASLENFLYFEDRFGKTTTIALSDNYRSGQNILDLSHSLIAVDEGPLQDLRVPLTAKNKIKSETIYTHFAHETLEDMKVVEKVGDLLKSGVEAKEVAIILRTNREVEHFAESLRRSGFEVNASADGDILHHPITTAVFGLITAIAEPSNEKALFTLLHSAFWNIEAADLVRLLSSRSRSLTLAELIKDESKLIEIGVKNPASILHVDQVLETARSREVTDVPHQVLAYALEESGFLTHVMKYQPIEGGRVLRRLYDEIELLVRKDNLSQLHDVVRQFKLRQEHNLPLNATYLNMGGEAVEVMTAHKAKGLEFAHVFVPHLTDSRWGGKRHPDYFKLPLVSHMNAEDFDPLDDEKRLLYVAMTRAKENLYLSFSDTDSEGKALSPSRLLAELDDSFFTDFSDTATLTDLDILEDVRAVPDQTILNSSLLVQVLSERGLSATSLNNYLQSPWQYIYRNILRVPEVQNLSMQYGTAIHAVLEQVCKKNRDKQQWSTQTEISNWLNDALTKLPISETDHAKLHQQGLESLVVYLEHLKTSLGVVTKEEFSIDVVLPTGLEALPELSLKGKLDRLDFDQDGKLLKVVDYKTGKPKTRNEIEGETKNSNGDYKRQLTFYALMLDLYNDERYKCRTGVISFVEPDKNGQVREEVFTITDEEIADLKEEIINMIKAVVSGEILTVECDPKQCDYCDLATTFLVKE